MNTITDARIATMFSQYERAFTTLDADALGELYSDVCLAAAPGFVACTQNRFELEAVRSHLYTLYQQVELTSARIIARHATELGAEHALVTVEWETQFRATGENKIRFKVSYLLQQNGDVARIIAFVSHADEQSLMRELGLLPD